MARRDVGAGTREYKAYWAGELWCPTKPDCDDKKVMIGVPLAGGSSRRAGVDERFLSLEGPTLLQRNLSFLHGPFPTVGRLATVAGRWIWETV